MPRYLVFDTETTGLHLYAKRGEPPIPADAPGQPRMCSFTGIPLNDKLEPIDADILSALIKPAVVDGKAEWEVSEGASAVNNITTEMCIRAGIPVEDVLRVWTQYITDGWVPIAWNAQFDTKIIRGELRRAGMPDLFEQTLNICAMKASTEICKIPPTGKMMASNRYAFKQPKLQEAYQHFFGEPFADAHSSLADSHATVRIVQELAKLGKLPEPSILYSKSRTDAPAA